MSLDNLVLATSNPGKISEIRERFDRELDITVAVLDDFSSFDPPDEPYETFKDNAMHKAKYYAARLGRVVLAEDSGLAVDALQGAPGVYSARYSGEPCDNRRNNKKLLQELQDVPDGQRQARYVAVIALAGDGLEETFCGTCEGRIAREETGAGGFGYDPLFIPAGHKRTFGVLDPEIKRTESHRMEALTKLLQWIKDRR